MADHIDFPISKFLTKEKLLKEMNKNDNSLIYHKYQKDGITFPNLTFSNDDAASEAVIDMAGKWEPIVAVKVLNKETATLEKLNKKTKDTEKKLEELQDSIDTFSYSNFYKEVRNRVLAEKSKTKSCHHCGHRHKTDSDNYYELPLYGCKKCEKQDYLFNTSDFKKLDRIKTKIFKTKNEVNELKEKLKLTINKSLKQRNWHWFISAGTKAVAEDLRGYDCDY